MVTLKAIPGVTRHANTYENVINSNALLEQQGWRRILLVSSPYHMRRAVGSFRRAHPVRTVDSYGRRAPTGALGQAAWGGHVGAARLLLDV